MDNAHYFASPASAFAHLIPFDNLCGVSHYHGSIGWFRPARSERQIDPVHDRGRQQRLPGYWRVVARQTDASWGVDPNAYGPLHNVLAYLLRFGPLGPKMLIAAA